MRRPRKFTRVVAERNSKTPSRLWVNLITTTIFLKFRIKIGFFPVLNEPASKESTRGWQYSTFNLRIKYHIYNPESIQRYHDFNINKDQGIRYIRNIPNMHKGDQKMGTMKNLSMHFLYEIAI